MRQDKSTDQQLAELDAFCKQYSLIHRNRFVDEAKSGGSTAGREDFNRMMEVLEIPANRPHGLLLWNHARFARDIDDAQFNKIKLRQWGLIIHSLNDQVPEGEYGRVIEFLIDVANEEKRKQTSVDSKRGLKELVEKYRCVPGFPPRGFKRTPINLGLRRDKTEHIAHRWDPDPDLIPLVKQAFQMKAAGATIKQIHAATHLYGSENSYTTFFQNKLFIGTLVFGDMTVKDYCDPTIDLATWNAVQKILALHADRQHVTASTNIHPRRKSETATYLLSGIAICARCKSPLYGHSAKQRSGSYYLRYACTRRNRRNDCDLPHIPARALEKEVINKITAFFDHPENLMALMDEEEKQNADLASKDKSAIKDLQKQINTVRRAINNITDALQERGGKSKALNERQARLEEQEADLSHQLETVKTRIPVTRQRLTHQEIVTLSQRISARLQTKDNAIIRRLLYGLVNSVEIDRNDKFAFGKITIHSPREPESPEDSPKRRKSPRRITVPTFPPPVGAPNKITFHWVVFLFKTKTAQESGFRKEFFIMG
jgi:site-specific DNA recombinase